MINNILHAIKVVILPIIVFTGCATMRDQRRDHPVLLYTVPSGFYTVNKDSVKEPNPPDWTVASIPDSVFRGVSRGCQDERAAMESAMDNVVANISRYLGTKIIGVSEKKQYVFNDSTFTLKQSDNFIIYGALVRLVKDQLWYKECWQDSSSKTYWCASVLAVCPKSELNKAETLLKSFRKQKEITDKIVYQLKSMVENYEKYKTSLNKNQMEHDSLRFKGSKVFADYDEYLKSIDPRSRSGEYQAAMDFITFKGGVFAKTWSDMNSVQEDFFARLERIQARRQSFPAELVPYVARMNDIQKRQQACTEETKTARESLNKITLELDKITASFKNEQIELDNIRARIENELPLEVVPK